MKHQDGFFSNKENQSIYYQNWFPDESVRAVLLIAHGLNEHCGRYQHLAEYFVNEGYAIYGFDYPGHGRSEGTRSYIKDFSEFTETLLIYIEKIKEWQPYLPIFILGHSMGGLVGAHLLIDHPDQVAGAILSGSLILVPDNISPITITIGKIISTILPKLGLAAIDSSGLSRDPNIIKAYRADPLVITGKVTTNLSIKMNQAMDRVVTDGGKINLPLLLLHGKADYIVDPVSTQFLYDLVSSENKKIIYYEGLYHEIYNEPEHDQVFEDVSSWLNKQLI
ncbi:MAG: lysophospholipase [Anaerolineales bacterium]